MPYTGCVTNLKRSWNTIAPHYARRYRISIDTVHYGPLCPGEDKLGLLGNIAGLCALDLGCGGGQNAVALANLGARVKAVDFSEAQIAAAEKLALEHGVAADFLVSDIGELPALGDGEFGLVLSVCAIAFVKDESRVFREAFRLLKHGGRFVLSDMHPLQYILDEIRGGVKFNHRYPFTPFRMRWRWEFDGDARSGVAKSPKLSQKVEAGFEHYVRSVPRYCNALIEAGFSVTRLLEPKPTVKTPHIGFSREIMREYPYIARNLPITFIIVAKKGA